MLQNRNCAQAHTVFAGCTVWHHPDTAAQCTIYQHHLPGTFSLLDPAALLSESLSVLRGTPCCHNTHHHMATPLSLPSEISDQIWSMRDQTSSNSSSLGKDFTFRSVKSRENILCVRGGFKNPSHGNFPLRRGTPLFRSASELVFATVILKLMGQSTEQARRCDSYLQILNY